MSHSRSNRSRIVLLGVLGLAAASCAPIHASRSLIVNEAQAFLPALFARRPAAPVAERSAAAATAEVSLTPELARNDKFLAAPHCTPVALFASRPADMSLRSRGTDVLAPEKPFTRAPELRHPSNIVLGDTLHVVHGRVGSYKRIIADEEGRNFDARAAILAREMNPQLPRGTEITAVYDTAYADREANQPRLVALQIGNGLSARRAFRVMDDAVGIDGFYTADGRTVEAGFLRYPLNFMLVTSAFSHGRKHPVLKKRRPHLGVDLAAPYDTPVLAVADGEVVEADWAGNYGRTVGIRHDAQYATGYSHLAAIAPGIIPGARVRKGDIIGFVGRSGLATGPHLHFSMLRGETVVDPLAARLPQSAPLGRTHMRSLRTAAAHLSQTFARAEAGREEPRRVASRSRR